MNEPEFSIEVDLLEFAEDASAYGSSAKLRVWIWQSLRHLLVGLRHGREHFLLKFRGSSGMEYTYMFVMQDVACLFQNPGDSTILARSCNSNAVREHVIVEEPE